MYQFQATPNFERIPPRSSRALQQRLPRVDARVPDLQSQLEGLLDAVWQAEANWRFDDRLDLTFRPGGA